MSSIRQARYVDAAGSPTMTVPFEAALEEAVTTALYHEAERLEVALAEAIRLQNFDKLDHLVVVVHPTAPRTVASMLDPQGPAPDRRRGRDPECPFTHAHTRHWCGYAGCRDS